MNATKTTALPEKKIKQARIGFARSDEGSGAGGLLADRTGVPESPCDPLLRTNA